MGRRPILAPRLSQRRSRRRGAAGTARAAAAVARATADDLAHRRPQRRDHLAMHVTVPMTGTLAVRMSRLTQAVDLNASRNPQGQKPHQDLRLVHVMERHGFWWGGRWPTVPDGMHFEYHGDGRPSPDEPF